MNTPNPLVPQGTFPGSRSKSHVRIAVFTIMAVHVVLLLGALHIAGCKKTDSQELVQNTTPSDPNPYPPVAPVPDSNQPPVSTSNNPTPVTPVTPITSNNLVTPVTPMTPITPATPETGGGAETEHVIVKGDSFYTLAKKNGVTMKAIAAANPGVDSSKLKIGQKIKIPAASAAAPKAAATSNGAGATNGNESVHTVKSGETLWGLAKKYGVKEKELRAANGLKSGNLKVGQKLKIPTKAAPAAASDTTSAPPAGVAPLAPTNP